MVRTRVELFRDAGEPSSIGIVADALIERLRKHPRLSISETSCRPLLREGPLSALSRRVARFGAYPLTALRSRSRADVFHVLSQSDAHLAYVLPSSRTVVTCHDLIPMRPDPGYERTSSHLERAVLSAGARLLPRVAAVVCPSNATRTELLSLLPVAPERAHVVPNGVDAVFRPLPQSVAVEGVPAGRAILLHVSTGAPHKNAAATLRVLQALLLQGHDVCLVRTGSRLTTRELALARDLGVVERVIELGMVPRERLIELYNAASLLLFPSFVEGFGLPVLEAMACGTPVVVSECAALSELVADAGLQAPPNDVAALTAATASVVTDAALATRLRVGGLERARSFTWDAAAAGYARIYEIVADGPS